MSDEQKCLECEQDLILENCVKTEHGSFCKPCYDRVLGIAKEMAGQQNMDINYLLSAVGGILGSGLGILIWWAVTFYSGYAVGIVAIVIGITVAKGITLLNGNKRSGSIQIMAVCLTILSFFYADYLVTRSFILKANAEAIDVLTLIPNPEIFYNLFMDTFDAFNLVFLGIAVWQTWSMTKPFKFE
jgi:hypothetical protein